MIFLSLANPPANFSVLLVIVETRTPNDAVDRLHSEMF